MIHDAELYELPTAEERAKMAAALRRLEAADDERKDARRTLDRKPRPKRAGSFPIRTKRKRKSKTKRDTPVDEDSSAYVTLPAGDWLALLRGLPAMLTEARSGMARHAIRSQVGEQSGLVTIWGTVDGFSCLVAELLRVRPGQELPGHGAACLVAAVVMKQVSRTRKW